MKEGVDGLMDGGRLGHLYKHLKHAGLFCRGHFPWTDGWTDGWTNGQMDAWTDGWMDAMDGSTSLLESGMFLPKDINSLILNVHTST